MRSRAAMAGVLALVLMTASSLAFGAAGEDPMLKGLQDRGLKTLSDLYVKQKPVVPVAPVGAAALPPGASKADQAKAQQDLALTSKNVAERDEAFKSAKTLYEQAIAEATTSAAAIPQEKIVERSAARLSLLKMHETVGNMLFLQWLKNDLDFLEVTDRRFGDRAPILALLKEATAQYKACLDDATAWDTALGRMDVKQSAHPHIRVGPLAAQRHPDRGE
jgi:hypothetical protein